jgi:hypothetical protein
MRYAVFYNRGEAFHQGSLSVPSHGCIHCGSSDAEWLFNWILGAVPPVAGGMTRHQREQSCHRADVMVIVIGPR